VSELGTQLRADCNGFPRPHGANLEDDGRHGRAGTENRDFLFPFFFLKSMSPRWRVFVITRPRCGTSSSM
jgi:hypothetical protein